MKNLTFKIFSKTSDLPSNWDEVAKSNHFLQSPYLMVLEQSAPINMQCFYIAIFKNSTLIGVALAQYLNVHQLESFGERDKCLKTVLRNFIFKNFASHVLFLGNNMITGQNSYAFSTLVDLASVSEILVQSAQALVTYFKEKKVNIHLVSFKDFYEHCSVELKKHHFSSLYEFNTQPNMIFNLPASWKTESDYVAAFSKKYRDQFKRAHKKIEGVEVRELDVNEVIHYEEAIYNLYHYVAQNAPFNTFFLAKNHFSTFKKQCGSRFRICGYFFEGRLVGFHSLLLNDNVLETYFLGYDETIQKEKMLYLNMLYNMTKFGIEHGFEKIIFGRTALEIKSSIGATPVQMSGFIYHTNAIVNKLIPKLFKRLEPETAWQQRHPFK